MRKWTCVAAIALFAAGLAVLSAGCTPRRRVGNVAMCPGLEPEATDLEKVSEFEGGVFYKVGKIHALQLNGSYRAMGRQYGELAKPQIRRFYEKSLVEHFPASPRVSRRDVEAFAARGYQRYPARIKEIFEGMAETSGLSVSDLAMLDQFVVLSLLPYAPSIAHCSGIAAWGEYTGGGPLVFGKNEDWLEYFKEFDDTLLVVVYNPDDGSRSAATVGNAGQVGTMNEINDAGLVLALNDGSPSGDIRYRKERAPTLVANLSFFLDSSCFAALDAALQSTLPPWPFVINVADAKQAYSYECTTSLCRRRSAQQDGLLVGTNTLVDPSWDFPEKITTSPAWREPTERRDNLIALGEKHKGKIDAKTMMAILDTPKSDGGATVPGTIFQFVAVPAQLKIWVKAPGYQDWVLVEVGRLFTRK